MGKIVYYKLKDILNRRGLRDYQLAEMCGMSTSTMSKVMQNRITTTDVICRICNALNVQPADIMEFVPDKNEG